MQNRMFQQRLCAQVAALNGVNFCLKHWAHVVAVETREGGTQEEQMIEDTLHFQYGAVSAVTYLVQAQPSNIIQIQSRDEYTLKISPLSPAQEAVEEDRRVVVWQFEVMYYDIAFYCLLDSKEVSAYPWQR